jgi:hypothetical protein
MNVVQPGRDWFRLSATAPSRTQREPVPLLQAFGARAQSAWRVMEVRSTSVSSSSLGGSWVSSQWRGLGGVAMRPRERSGRYESRV